MQRAALPSKPFVTPFVSITGAVVPSTLVSGDLFDVVTSRSGSVTAVLLDVAGHGAAAALIASAARDNIRRTLHAGVPLGVVASNLESCLASQGDVLNAVAALGLVRFHPGARVAEVLNAGLVPISLLRPDAPPLCFPSRSPPPGLFSAREHPFDVVPLRGQGVFLLMSDGLTGGDSERASVLDVCARTSIGRAGWAAGASAPEAIAALIRENAPSIDGVLTDDATLVVASFDARPNDREPVFGLADTIRPPGVG